MLDKIQDIKKEIESLKKVLKNLKKYPGNQVYKEHYRKKKLIIDKNFKSIKSRLEKLKDSEIKKKIDSINEIIDYLFGMNSPKEKLNKIDDMFPLWNDIEVRLEQFGAKSFSELFSSELINDLGKKFESDIRDLRLMYGQSGNCTAFLLRKILEKLIYFSFVKHNRQNKIMHGNKFLGLEKTIDIASTEKVYGVHFLLPKTAKNIKGIKFLGDTSAHNPLTNVKMETILPQMPFIITAYEELSKKL